MYAIKNKRTGRYVYGTDRRRTVFTQLTSAEQALTYESRQRAETDMLLRKCGKDYSVVRVQLVEIDG